MVDCLTLISISVLPPKNQNAELIPEKSVEKFDGVGGMGFGGSNLLLNLTMQTEAMQCNAKLSNVGWIGPTHQIQPLPFRHVIIPSTSW